MHPEATNFVIEAIQQHGPFERVLEVGSRDVNGTIKGHFMDHGTELYVGVDLREGPNVDIVGNFADVWMVSDVADTSWMQELHGQGKMTTGWQKYDAIVCVNVLEHTSEGEGITRNAYRALREGGWWIMSAAYNWPHHSGEDGGLMRPGEWYRNVQPGEVEHWCEDAGFTDYHWSIDPMQRDVRVLARK